MISVIVPAYNSEKTIEKTIIALLNQNYPKDQYEIIVIDDGSTDKTFEIASKFSIKVIKIKHKGPAYARNLGARKSRGGIIIFIDSDCIPDKDWLKHMIKPFKDPEIVGVSGTYRTLNKESLVARFSGYEIEERHKHMTKQKYIDWIGTFSAAYRKNIFFKFSGFKTGFKIASGEDPELSYRISKAGYKMLFQQRAIVAHPHPDTIFKYLKQKYYRGLWRNMMYWSGHKDKLIKADSYTKKTLFPEIIITALVTFFLFILAFLAFPIIFILLSIILSIFSIATIANLDLIYFIWKKDKIVSLASTVILPLRNIVVIIGIIEGLFRYILKKY